MPRSANESSLTNDQRPIRRSTNQLRRPSVAAGTQLIEDHPSPSDQESQDNFDRVAEMARDAYKIGKEIMGMINIEYKRYQSTLYGSFQPNVAQLLVAQSGGQTVGFYNPLYEITQAVTDDDRVGDSIKLQSYVLKARVQPNAAAVVAYHVRFILFWDQTNQVSYAFAEDGAASQTSGLLDQIGLATTAAVFCTKDYDGDAKTKILWEHLVKVGPPNSDTSSQIIQVRIPINRHTQYENNSATINSGALKLLILGETNAVDRPNVVFYHQVYFTDD